MGSKATRRHLRGAQPGTLVLIALARAEYSILPLGRTGLLTSEG
jgi:hypothetical protein